MEEEKDDDDVDEREIRGTRSPVFSESPLDACVSGTGGIRIWEP